MGLTRVRLAARNPILLFTVTVSLSLTFDTALAVDKYAAEFLRVGAGARAIGMGGAFAAVADDASATYWNPAGMSFLGYREVMFQHSAMFGNQVKYNFGSIVWPLAKEGSLRPALGFSIIQLGVDDIPVTPEAGALRPGIDFEDNDGDPNTNLPTEGNGTWDPGERLFLSEGSFSFQSANDWGFLFSYSRPFGTKVSAGANAKLLYRTLPGAGETFSAYGAGLDAGLTWQVSDPVTLAFVARDFTSTVIVWNTDSRERVSPNFVLGSQYTTPLGVNHVITLALDIPFNFDGQTLDQRFGTTGEGSGLSGTINAGFEYWYANTLGLRSGMMGRDLTFGAGIRHKKIGADYAAVFNQFFNTQPVDFSGDGDLEVTHRISGSYDF